MQRLGPPLLLTVDVAIEVCGKWELKYVTGDTYFVLSFQLRLDLIIQVLSSTFASNFIYLDVCKIDALEEKKGTVKVN